MNSSSKAMWSSASFQVGSLSRPSLRYTASTSSRASCIMRRLGLVYTDSKG